MAVLAPEPAPSKPHDSTHNALAQPNRHIHCSRCSMKDAPSPSTCWPVPHAAAACASSRRSKTRPRSRRSSPISACPPRFPSPPRRAAHPTTEATFGASDTAAPSKTCCPELATTRSRRTAASAARSTVDAAHPRGPNTAPTCAPMHSSPATRLAPRPTTLPQPRTRPALQPAIRPTQAIPSLPALRLQGA